MPNHAFTFRYGGIAPQLGTHINICLPTDIGTPPKQCHQINAIWDTGATKSTITKAVVDKLGLIPSGKITVNGVGGAKAEYTYFVSIVLPNRVVIPNIMVCGCDNLVGGFDALIGMDIIGLGDLAITKEDKKTVMSFVLPSMNTIDYVEKVNQKKKQLNSNLHKKAVERRKKERKNKKKSKK